MNKHYVRLLSPQELFTAALPFLQKAEVPTENKAYVTAALVTEQQRAGTLEELVQAIAAIYFPADWQASYPSELLVWKKSTKEKTLDLISALLLKIESISDTDFASATSLETLLLSWIDNESLGRGDTLWPMRVALTGKEHSPGPFEVASVLGKEETMRRLQAARAKLS